VYASVPVLLPIYAAAAAAAAVYLLYLCMNLCIYCCMCCLTFVLAAASVCVFVPLRVGLLLLHLCACLCRRV
jgi:hypothetical protein